MDKEKFIDSKFKELMDKMSALNNITTSTNDFLDSINIVKSTLESIYDRGYSAGYEEGVEDGLHEGN